MSADIETDSQLIAFADMARHVPTLLTIETTSSRNALLAARGKAITSSEIKISNKPIKYETN